MAWIEAASFRNRHDGAVVADSQAGTEIGITPPEADHLVVSLPIQKRIVGGMQNHRTAAGAHILFERFFYRRRPLDPI